MAEMDWARPAPASEPSLFARLPRLMDWEAAIALALVLGATLSVTVVLEAGGWSRQMPALTNVGVLAVGVSTVLARSRLPWFLAWPLALLTGVVVVVWQTLAAVGPGGLEARIDEVYARFAAWTDVAGSNAVTSDSLPFNTMVLALTWVGVFLFGWSVFRWHNAWIGVIPGGVAIFLDLTLVGDDLTGSAVLYMVFGCLLVMQTNLLSRMARWRREGTEYPGMINLTFLNFSFWALLTLVIAAWVVPVGPYSTPAPVQAGIDGVLALGTDFVRLAGPLHSSKVIPVHEYSGALPFQGSVNLGERELLSVRVKDPSIQGPFLLRGNVYDEYSSGGWTAGDRRSVKFPPSAEESVREGVSNDELDGIIVPLEITLEAKSIAGTVVFAPGEVLHVSRELAAEIPAGSTEKVAVDEPGDGRELSDTQVLLKYAGVGLIGLQVVRGDGGTVRYVEVARLDEQGVLDQAVRLDPGARIKRNRSYDLSAFVPAFTPEALRTAGTEYPLWVREQYLQLPGALPPTVPELAEQLAGEKTNPYDQAKALEDYLRTYPVAYDIGDTPEGRDTVEYFLFEERRGYFDYHASAMVVMLRSLGVPVRLAVGFAIEDEDIDDETGAYIARDRNAYAWPEVYFPGHGWVAFNPSPDRPAELQPSKREGVEIGGDSIQDLLDQLPVSGQDLLNRPPEGDVITAQGASDSGGFGFPISAEPGAPSLVTLGILAFMGAMGVAAFAGWQRSVTGLPYEQQLWEKTVRMASWAGMPPGPGQTPHESAKRLGKRFRDVWEWDEMADAYTRSMFGHKEPGDEEKKRLQAIWPDARGALTGGIMGRPFRRKRKD
jgi:transglutaminase-like putative cysteine protease